MSHDDPKLTAHALGELDEVLQLDGDAARIVQETALVARILTKQLNRRRRVRRVRLAAAACVVVAVAMLALLPGRSSEQTTMIVNAEDPSMFPVRTATAPILHLAPVLAELPEPSSISNTKFRGIVATDVDQLVTAVLQDASRVGTFRPLRLAPESPVAF